MVWAVVAVIVVLGVGLPAVGWWATTRRPTPVTADGPGHGEIDAWLFGQFGLGYRDREEVRAAVLAGRPVSHPGLEAAVHEFATRVLARRFRSLRRAERLGWFTLISGFVYAAFGVAMLIIGGPDRWQTVAAVALINGPVLIVLGWHQAIYTPRRVRRNGEHILRPSQDAVGSAQ